MLESGKLNIGLFMTTAYGNVPDIHRYTPYCANVSWPTIIIFKIPPTRVLFYCFFTLSYPNLKTTGHLPPPPKYDHTLTARGVRLTEKSIIWASVGYIGLAELIALFQDLMACFQTHGIVTLGCGLSYRRDAPNMPTY